MTLDPRERFEDSQEASRQSLQGKQAEIWTAVPVIFKSHDVSKNIVSVQPTIKLKYAKPDGTAEWIQMPLLQDVPLHYPGGGGVVHTFPIKDGDEGLVVFSSRSIDKWWQQGGVQEQTEFRMHDISDGFAIPGFRSQPRKLSNISSTKHQIRTENGEHYIEIDPENNEISIKSSNPVTIDTPMLRVTGNIIAGYNQGHNVTLLNHTHSQPVDSDGDSEEETIKPTSGT